MTTTLFQPGSPVYFGRPNGEKTKGEVVKVNPLSYRVKQMEDRGGHPVGTVWTVPKALCYERKGAPGEGEVSAPATPGPARADVDILLDISDAYSRLSPENLAADGERPRYQQRRLGTQLRRKLAALFTELGRRVDEDEAFRLTEHVRFPNRARAT